MSKVLLSETNNNLLSLPPNLLKEEPLPNLVREGFSHFRELEGGVEILSLPPNLLLIKIGTSSGGTAPQHECERGSSI